MKKSLQLLCLIFLSFRSFSQENTIKIHVQNNRIFSLIRFVESLSGGMNTSRQINKIFQKSKYNTPEIYNYVNEYNNGNRYVNYQMPGYPTDRLGSYLSTWTTFLVASATANTLSELKNKLAGTVPNESLENTFVILQKFDPIFEELVWKPTEKSRENQRQNFEKYIIENQLLNHFTKLKTFFGAIWPNDMVYEVMLNPIPNNEKIFTNQGTAVANVVFLDANVNSVDFESGASVMFHEMSHTLSMQQNLKLQQDIDRWYKNSKSPNRKFAYSLLEEGYVTPAGEWLAKQITNKLSTSEWYNDKNIDQYAKAMYLFEEEYIESGKTVDSTFIAKSISVFDQEFPTAAYDYISLFRKMLCWTDAPEEGVRQTINDTFNSTSSMSSNPILDDTETSKIVNSGQYGNIVIVSKENKKTLDFLKKNVLALKKQKLDANKEFGFSVSIDGNALVLINLKDIKRLKDAVAKMKLSKSINQLTPFWYF